MARDERPLMNEAAWVENLRHRPDPNRLHSAPTPAPDAYELPAMPPRHGDTVATEPSYYDVPLLKPPVWKWEIASYFFLGGLSAGAYLLARTAERAGGKKYRDLTRLGSYVAFLALLPCPPLLIADLGDPKRFHHMLRVWKPSSPMNFGTWSLVAYSGMVTSEVIRQYLNEHGARLGFSERSKLRKLMNNGVLLLLHDAAGMPFSLIVASYTGLLLSCTANPLWSKNPALGPLFSASAISTGAEAVSLALEGRATASPAQVVLKKVDTLAHIAEVLLLGGFFRFAGEKAAPLRQGRMQWFHRLSLGGLLASEFLKLLPGWHRRKPVRILSSALGLLAGFSMRWAMVFAGRDAAQDPHLSRLAGRASESLAGQQASQITHRHQSSC